MWKRFIIPGFLVILPFILILPSFLYLFNHTIILFPNPEYYSRIESFATQNSSIENLHIDSSNLTVTYNLREKDNGESNPYCDIVFWLQKENVLMDLSGYDYLSLKVANATAESVVIYLKTFEQGVSKPERTEAYYLRHNEYSLPIKPEAAVYQINIDDFIAPDWWFDLMHIPKTRSSRKTYAKTVALDFQFLYRGIVPLPDKDQVFTITGIAFYKTYPGPFIILNIITLLYCIFLFRILFIRRHKIFRLIQKPGNSPLMEIRHKPLELGNYAKQELDCFIKYLEEHYYEPDLSISVISRETGISQAHIRQLVKKRYNSTCKQIINWVRLKEAKRLLKETGRRIIEIAQGVGFDDISTFNRCFKQQEGITPSQYRNKMQ